MRIRKTFQGELPENKIVNIQSNSQTDTYSCDYVNNKFENIDVTTGGVSGDTLPIGSMIPYGKATPPTNWLVCDGSAVSRTTYAELFEVIGTSYGAGDGSTTFNLPNKKGKVSVGLNTSDSDFNAIGKTGGEKTHTLTINEMPSHSHGQSLSGDERSGEAYYDWNIGNVRTYTGGDLSKTAGGGQAHNNLQPYQVDNWIIKAFQSSGVVGNVLNAESDSETDTYSCDYVNNLLNILFPIGKVEIFYDNDDHSNYLGFKWERTSMGRFPIGAGTGTDTNNDTRTLTVGQKGGAYRHKLSINEMPSHNHETSWRFSGGSGSSYGVSWTNGYWQGPYSNALGAFTMNNTGGGQPHNNIPTYEAMAFWKRIS